MKTNFRTKARAAAAVLLAATMLAGCSREMDLIRPAGGGDIEEAARPLTRSLGGAVYNEVVDVWMVPQPDPFTLENMQAAYDKLAAGSSAQALTEAQSAEFPAGRKLAPTHYALKIYPRDEEEQWRVEMMEDVDVAYIPFCYAQLTREEAERMERSGMTRSAANTFAERSPYTVTYENEEVTDGGPTGPVTFQLPILYTVWPASKPFPEDLEYVVDYPVYLPDEGTDVNEAVMNPSTRSFPAGVGVWVTYTFSSEVTTYDEMLNKNVPMANLKVRHQVGSRIFDAVTNGSGRFNISYRTFFRYGDDYNNDPYGKPLTFIYHDTNTRWKIVPNGVSTPYSVALTTTPSEIFYNDDESEVRSYTNDVQLTSSAHQENEIHRAANYFFNNQTYFTHPTVSGGLSIVANDDTVSSGNKGLFSYNSSGFCHIDIYNHGYSAGSVIGTTLHELGHAAHWKNSGGYYSFKAIPPLLQESFASYSGWYLGEEYYVSLGATRPGSGNWTITGDQDRQNWYKNYSLRFPWGSGYYYYGWYSPLFIDLTDTYNQKTTPTSRYPNDNIQGVPPSVIWNIISTSKTWDQCRLKLQSYVGTYYTTTNFNNWIADFDTWTATYPLTVQ